MAVPAPVLVVDTCGVLDVVRSLHRSQAPIRLLEVGNIAVRASSRNPPALHIIIFDEIEKELLRNIPGEHGDLQIQMKKLKAAGGIALGPLNAYLWNRCVGKIEGILSCFPDHWMGAGHRIFVDPPCEVRARARLASGTRPGKRGSNNLGDCLITEHLLEAAKELRDAGFSRDILFVSSNMRDYGGPILKSPLNTELSSFNIDFYQDIDGAMRQLGF